MSHGKILKAYLRSNDIRLEAFIEDVSISRQTLYNWFEKNIFDQSIIDRIVNNSKVPRKIFTKENEQVNSETKITPNMDRLINMLEKAVDALSEDNKHLRAENAHATALIRDYLKQNNFKAKSA